ncbi:MAG: ParB/RepB/Spo0J family partition protein [Planctomycetaceae bacterium]|nr:ParB/RepB/Spo0J family partition protein [Planctomycetaceae bacterium]
MGKADDLLRSMGGIITESASHRGTPAAMPAAASGPHPASDRPGARSKVAFDIPIDAIEPDPAQPREQFDHEPLERLADSIRSKGVLQPLRVRWDESKFRYILIVGERRWRAAGLAGLDKVPCVVDDRTPDPGEILALQLIENCLREDLTPIEQAAAFKKLMDVNRWSGNRLAKELGIPQSAISQALSLLSLPAPVQDAVDHGELPASTACEISKLPDASAQEELAARVVRDGLTRAQTTSAIRRRKVTERVLDTESGPRVTVSYRRGLDVDLVIAALRDALQMVESERADAA